MTGKSRIISTGMTSLGKLGRSTIDLKLAALNTAFRNLDDVRIGLRQLDGLVTIPSLAEPLFMDAHHLATSMHLFHHRDSSFVARTIDTGGAGPITAILEADRMIKYEGCSLVAVVAGDSIASLPSNEFLKKANASLSCSMNTNNETKPLIPLGYNRVAEWMVDSGNVTREQLAMVSVLMNRQASLSSLKYDEINNFDPSNYLNKVLSSQKVGSATSLMECARRADGAAAVLIASSEFIDKYLPLYLTAPAILGGGEASGSIIPADVISDDIFSCKYAAQQAFNSSGLNVNDIDYFGIYDCFPVCFIRALEDIGLATQGKGGQWVQQRYEELVLVHAKNDYNTFDNIFPVNTHGGLLGQGAPWETPALFSAIEGNYTLIYTIKHLLSLYLFSHYVSSVYYI